METSVKYVVNGAVSTVWSRIRASKTTYIVLAFVLANAIPLFEGASWQSIDAWQKFFPYIFGGVVLIMLRSASKQTELAANAVNPAVRNVRAVEEPKGGGDSYGKIGAMIAVAGLLGIGLTGCGALGAAGNVVTNLDGKPVVSGTICVNTPNGRFCYMPTEPTIIQPETVPDGVAVVPASTLATPINMVPVLPGPASYNDVPPPRQKLTLEK